MSWKLKAGLRELLAAEEDLSGRAAGGGLRIVLAFANTYRLAMSNLGFMAVFQLLRRRPGLDCRRAFLPEPQDLAEHRRTRTPWLTLEDQEPVAGAEIIAFSLPYENDYLNLISLLHLAGLPALATERGAGPPLILAGGVAPSLNPEPLAPMMDAVLIGEAEAVLPEFLDLYQAFGAGGREEFLGRAAREVPGIYAPRLYRPRYDGAGRFLGHQPVEAGLPARIERRYVKELTEPTVSEIVTGNTEFGDRVLIELSRGCSRACRFCAAGHLLRPPRQAPFGKLLQAVTEAVERRGQAGLISAAVSDLPGIEELCLAAVHQGGRVSVSSLRADTLSPTLASLLAQAGVQTVTLAPEAGSQRLREVINKGLSEEEILEAAQVSLEAGLRRLRLYFMLGLPTETDEDVADIGRLTLRLIERVERATDGRLSFNLITLSVASFVPKPQTPFQWAGMPAKRELNRRAGLLKQSLKGVKRVKLGFEGPRQALLEGLIARGDRRVGLGLIEIERAGGNMERGLRAAGIDPAPYLHRERDRDEAFPWEIVDTGLKRDHLWAEYQKALAGRPSPGCFEGCQRCGVC